MASTKFKSSQFVVDSDVDYKGKKIKNAGFEVVSSLPTTNLFVGRKVCYSGKDYIYNGSAWTNDATTLDGLPRNVIYPLWNGKVTPADSMASWLPLFASPAYSMLNDYAETALFESSSDGINYTNLNLTSVQKNCFIPPIDSNDSYKISMTDKYSLRITLFINTSINIRCFALSCSGGSAFKIETRVENGTWVTKHDFGEVLVGWTNTSFITTDINTGWGNSEIRITLLGNLAGYSMGSYNNLMGYSIYSPKINKRIYAVDYNKNVYFPASAISNETINCDINNVEPTQTGLSVVKTSSWWRQYLVQTANFLWFKLKDLFSTNNDGYIPKIDNTNKKLVKSNIQDDGSRVQIDSPLRVNSKTYYDLAYLNGSGVGIIKIKTPWTGEGDTNNTMSIIEIDIRNHSSEKAAKLTIYFYVYNTSMSYNRTWATLIGDLPSKVIKTCYDPTNKCILIGETTTVWSYTVINISKVINGFNRTLDDSTGWDINYITDTSTYTGITDVKHINKGLDADLLDGYHASDFATSAQGTKADTALQAITTTLEGNLINSATAKTTPVDTDMVGLMDSAASNILKKLSWANIKATLKTYFDSLYALTGHNHNEVYLGKTAQAVDSDKLDGKHASDFATASHTHTISAITDLETVSIMGVTKLKDTQVDLNHFCSHGSVNKSGLTVAETYYLKICDIDTYFNNYNQRITVDISFIRGGSHCNALRFDIIRDGQSNFYINQIGGNIFSTLWCITAGSVIIGTDGYLYLKAKITQCNQFACDVNVYTQPSNGVQYKIDISSLSNSNISATAPAIRKELVLLDNCVLNSDDQYIRCKGVIQQSCVSSTIYSNWDTAITTINNLLAHNTTILCNLSLTSASYNLRLANLTNTPFNVPITLIFKIVDGSCKICIIEKNRGINKIVVYKRIVFATDDDTLRLQFIKLDDNNIIVTSAMVTYKDN